MSKTEKSLKIVILATVVIIFMLTATVGNKERIIENRTERMHNQRLEIQTLERANDTLVDELNNYKQALEILRAKKEDYSRLEKAVLNYEHSNAEMLNKLDMILQELEE